MHLTLQSELHFAILIENLVCVKLMLTRTSKCRSDFKIAKCNLESGVSAYTKSKAHFAPLITLEGGGHFDRHVVEVVSENFSATI